MAPATGQRPAGPCLFLPVHDNHVENLAALASAFPARAYLYDWAMCPTEARHFFEQLRVPVKPFTLETLLEDLIAEPRPVVFVLTANLSHAVGKAQYRLFTLLQELLPAKVADVFHVGHCMYGCHSCAIKSHNVPLFFTRHHNNTLGITEGDLRARLRAPEADAPVVLIAPSLFMLSLLNDDDIVSTLCSLVSEGGASFAVKPHPLLSHTNAAYPSFHQLETEAAAIDRILSSGTHGDADPAAASVALFDFWGCGWSSLPALQLADIVVTDVDSSLAFEALAMPGTVILAYTPPGKAASDPELLQHYNVFSTPEELRHSYAAAMALVRHRRLQYPDSTAPASLDAAAPTPDTAKVVTGRAAAFFRRLYGEVDGAEPQRLAAQRGWLVPREATTGDLDMSTLLETVLHRLAGSRLKLFASEQLVFGCPSRDLMELYSEWRAHSQRQTKPSKGKATPALTPSPTLSVRGL